MEWKAPITPARLSLLPLLALMVLALTLSSCNLPGLSTDSNADEAVTEQSDDQSGDPDTSSDVSPDQQQVPDEAYVLNEEDGQDTTASLVRIVEGGLQEPRTLNPVLVGDPLSEEISQLVFSGLISVDPETAEPVPDLATSWEISRDGLTYLLELRDDVTWHDGQTFTAQDVVFTYELMMNERTRSPRYSRLVERITAVKAIDGTTVEFRLVAPYAPFLTTLASFGIVPRHLLSEVLPDELVTNPFGISSAVGTGPFVLSRWDRGERILFRANGNHYDSPPAFDQYEYRVVAEDEDLISGLQHMSIDWARITPDQAVAASEIPGVEVLSIPSFEMVSVALQLDPGGFQSFDDPRVRQALLLSLDRQAAVDEIWHGHAEVAHGTLPPASAAFRRSSIRYGYDPARAADLLVQAGWFTSDEGIRMKDGIPLQFSVTTNGDNPARRALAEWLVASWREIGIDARVQFETWGTVRDKVTTSRDFEALILGYRWDIDPDQHAMWSSDSILDAFNVSGYVNLELDQLLDDALATADQDQRAEIYADVQDLVMMELPQLPLVFPYQTVAIGPRLHEVEPTAILVRNRATISEWVPVESDQGNDDGG